MKQVIATINGNRYSLAHFEGALTVGIVNAQSDSDYNARNTCTVFSDTESESTMQSDLQAIASSYDATVEIGYYGYTGQDAGIEHFLNPLQNEI